MATRTREDGFPYTDRTADSGLNRGDVPAADAVFAPDCVVHMTGVAEALRAVGPWKELVAGLLRAFPDLHFTIEDQLVQGDRVAFRWRATPSFICGSDRCSSA